MINEIKKEIGNITNLYNDKFININTFINKIDFNEKENKVILQLNPLGDDESKNKLINREIIKALKLNLKISGVKLIFEETIKKIDLYGVKVIAIGSGKGGVGKSQVSFNLANTLVKKGYKTALIDADILGYSIPKLSGVYGELRQDENKNIIPLKNDIGLEIMSSQYFIGDNKNEAIMWRASKFNQLLEKFFKYTAYASDLEYLIIDLPPGTGDVTLSLNQYFDKLNFLFVTTPSDDAYYVAKRALGLASELEFNTLGIINNMAYYEINGEKHYIFGKSEYESLIDIPIKGEENYFPKDYLNYYYNVLVDKLLGLDIEENK